MGRKIVREGARMVDRESRDERDRYKKVQRQKKSERADRHIVVRNNEQNKQ